MLGWLVWKRHGSIHRITLPMHDTHLQRQWYPLPTGDVTEISLKMMHHNILSFLLKPGSQVIYCGNRKCIPLTTIHRRNHDYLRQWWWCQQLQKSWMWVSSDLSDPEGDLRWKWRRVWNSDLSCWIHKHPVNRSIFTGYTGHSFLPRILWKLWLHNGSRC